METIKGLDQQWYAEAKLMVVGPKEKPIILRGRYLGTKKEIATNLQDEFGLSIAKLNATSIPGEGQDWFVEISVMVAGPKEKPIVLDATYLGTHKAVAVLLQNKWGEKIAEMNDQKPQRAGGKTGSKE